MSREQELKYLRETMEEYENASVELDQMVTQWAAGDVDNLEKLLVEEMKSEGIDLYQALLVNRNANWAVKIEDMLKGNGTTFIAVGSRTPDRSRQRPFNAQGERHHRQRVQ